MSADAITSRLREWLVVLFVRSIRSVSREEDRLEVIRWLTLSRDVVGSDKPKKDKLRELYALIDSRKTTQIVVNSVVEGVKNYKNADLPVAVKVAVPLTLLAVPIVGGQGAGVAALGGAIGLPILLLIFLGTAGLTSIIEAFAGCENARSYLQVVLEHIAHDEVLRHVRAAVRNGTEGEPREPTRSAVPEEERALRESLHAMDPYEFESHVMSFFVSAGLVAWATRKANDKGVDGFAKHPDGLIVTQCKRYDSGNLVGRPDIHRFWGAVEEHKAVKGYFVTTSKFTNNAIELAKLSEKLVLIDLDQLVLWHKNCPSF